MVYNTRGQIIHLGLQRIGYDATDRPRTLKKLGAGASTGVYRYDGHGRRVNALTREDGEGLKRHYNIYDAAGTLIWVVEYNGADASEFHVSTYVQMNGKPPYLYLWRPHQICRNADDPRAKNRLAPHRPPRLSQPRHGRAAVVPYQVLSQALRHDMCPMRRDHLRQFRFNIGPAERAFWVGVVVFFRRSDDGAEIAIGQDSHNQVCCVRL